MGDDKFMKNGASGAKQQKNNAKVGAKAKPVSAKVETTTVDEIDSPDQTISLFLAIGLIVGALVVGLIVGYVVAPKSGSTDFGAPTAGSAPSLTPDQLNTKQLPPSHPTVPGMDSAPAGGTEATAPEGGTAPTDGAKTEKPADSSKKSN